MNFQNFAAALIISLGVAGFTTSCTKKSEAPNPNTTAAKATTGTKKPLYRCSMHPAVTSDKPGDICPICHMNLEKVDDEDAHAGPAVTSGGIEGRAGFNLSMEKQQNIGVTAAKIVNRQLSYEVRASGRVAFDPDLYTAVEEYRQALMSRAQMSDGLMREQADKLLTSAKTKLRLMGLADDQIRKLSSSENSPMSLLLPKGAVWVYAEVFEYEVAGLRSGLAIDAEAPAVPGKIFSGKVSSISPVVNSPTRTVRLRALVPDPEGLLRPDTFVSVKIKVDLGEKLAVPESSVLFSGDQKFVFVTKENGRFEPRAIRTGMKAQNYYEVLSGLEAGETVVTSANFLIDSESRLRGVLDSAAQQNAAEPAKPSHTGHGK